VTFQGVEAFFGTLRQCLEAGMLSSQAIEGRTNDFLSTPRSAAIVEDSTEYFQR
jgi:hypothetical protein